MKFNKKLTLFTICLALIGFLFLIGQKDDRRDAETIGHNGDVHLPPVHDAPFKEKTERVEREIHPNNQTRFSATPSGAISRGDGNLITFGDLIIKERAFTAGKVFPHSPFTSVSEETTGSLTHTELTKSATEAEFNAQVIEDFLASDAEYLKVPINASENALISVRRTYDRGEHTVTLFGHSNDLVNNETFLVFHDGKVEGMIHEVYPYQAWEYASAGNGKIAIRELDTSKDIYGECSNTADLIVEPPLPQPSKRELNHPSLRGASLDDGISSDEGADMLGVELNSLAPGINYDVTNTSATKEIDMVISYMQTAADALGGISAAEARIIGHVDSLNQVFINSNLNDVVFKVVGMVLETVDIAGNPAAPGDATDHNNLQTLLGADLSGVIRFGGGGSAWTPGGSSASVFVYEGFQVGHQVGIATGSSFTHEICHNFKANHAYLDGGYNNSVSNEYWYGWRFRPEGYNYRTLMSYTTNATVGTNAANGYGPRIGYLSTPNQTYNAAVSSGTVPVALGAVQGFNGSSYPMDPSLLTGGRNGTFTFNDNGTPSDYTDDTFTDTAGGATALYNGTHTFLGADNNYLVGQRIDVHVNNNTRSTTNQIITQPGSTYVSGDEVTTYAYLGDHCQDVTVDLYKGGVFLMTIDTSAMAAVHQYSWSIPFTGLSDGTDYTLRFTDASSQVVETAQFEIDVRDLDPVAHWKLNDCQGTDVRDSSGNGHDGTLAEGAWTGGSGKDGGAVTFSAAAGGIDLPASAFSGISDEVSLSFWAYGDAGANTNTVFSAQQLKDDGSIDHNMIIYLPLAGTVYWDAGQVDAVSKLDPDRLTAGGVASGYLEGRWNHWIFTKNSNTGVMSIYLNGSLLTSTTGKTESISPIISASIGDLNNVGLDFQGKIDDFRVYDIELQQSEVSLIYQEYKAHPNLVGHWSIDDGSSTTVPDLSGNGHDATFNAGTGGVWTASGFTGGALEVDEASGYISLPASVTGEYTDQLTISFWTYGGDALPRGTAFLSGGGTGGFGLHLPWSSGQLIWDAPYGNRIQTPVLPAAEYKGQWNHYTLTKDATAGDMKIYVNGVKKAETLGSMTTALPSGGAINIGSVNAAAYWDGKLDEIKVFNKALTEAEVSAEYVTEIGGNGFDVYVAAQSGMTDTTFSGNGDGDDISNGIEFIFGGAAGVNDYAPDITTTRSATSTVFSFDRVEGSDDCTCQVFQYGINLSTWTDVLIDPADTAVTVTPAAGGLETVTVSVSHTGFSDDVIFFGRLKATE